MQPIPQPMIFDCKYVVPQGLTTVRYFDLWMNQFAHKTFYLLYEGNLFGTQQFKTLSDYNNFMMWNCGGGVIFALINGCKATINGMTINLN